MCDCCCREIPVRVFRNDGVEVGAFCSDCVPPMEEVLAGPYSLFEDPFTIGEVGCE